MACDSAAARIVSSPRREETFRKTGLSFTFDVTDSSTLNKIVLEVDETPDGWKVRDFRVQASLDGKEKEPWKNGKKDDDRKK